MTLTDASDAGVGLSTQPAPPPPSTDRGGLRFALVGAWRSLTSMRTALLLLFLLALAAVPGTLVPQTALNASAVAEFRRDHPSLAPLYDRLGLFDVFATPWFAAVYLLLTVSLLGCIVPRARLHARALRTPPPPAPRHLDRLPVSATWTTAATPEQAQAAARAALRGWRRTTRVETGAGEPAVAVAAERGALRETGNLLFHVAVVALLAAVATGTLFGYKASVLVEEGEGFFNTVTQYDRVEPGRLTDMGALPPFGLSLDDFRATYLRTGQPTTFEADVRLQESPDAPEREAVLRVNAPVDVGGARVYLIGHGYAVQVRVTDARGEVVLEDAVPCLPVDATFRSDCTVKAPEARAATGDEPAQLGFAASFTPTSALGPTGAYASVHPAAQDPGLTVQAYRGDLGLDTGRPQSVYSLDRRQLASGALTPVGDPRFLTPGESLELPGGGRLDYLGQVEWATLQVTDDPGKWPALAASLLLLLGLTLSLTVRRRRVWVRVLAAGPARTVVAVGGLARSDAERFRQEADALVERLRRDLPPAAETPAAPRPETPAQTPAATPADSGRDEE